MYIDRHIFGRIDIAGEVTRAGAAISTLAAAASAQEKPMPLAQIYVPEGALTLDQKRAMIKGVTDVIAGVENLPDTGRPYVTVLIIETPNGGWGVAGHGYVLAEFPQLIAGKPILPAS
jgi:4-oxalocrotonate tautomerase